ncbi:MAG: hypothetical protein HOY75_09795 [Streptomyces sp.]|nr:hypothetical protein [Streptomyces sp.]
MNPSYRALDQRSARMAALLGEEAVVRDRLRRVPHEKTLAILAGVPTIFGRLLRQPDRDAYGMSRLAGAPFRRRGDAGPGAARLPGGVRLCDLIDSLTE